MIQYCKASISTILGRQNQSKDHPFLSLVGKSPQVQILEFYEKFVTKHNYGQSMSYKAKAALNRFINGPEMNSRAFEEKSQKSAKSEIFKNALDFSPLMLDRWKLHWSVSETFSDRNNLMKYYFMHLVCITVWPKNHKYENQKSLARVSLRKIKISYIDQKMKISGIYRSKNDF